MNNANVDLSTPETSSPLGACQKTIKPRQVITSLYAKEIVQKGKKKAATCVQDYCKWSLDNERGQPAPYKYPIYQK